MARLAAMLPPWNLIYKATTRKHFLSKTEKSIFLSRVESSIFVFPKFFFSEKVIIDAINVIKTNKKNLKNKWRGNIF